MAENWLKLNDFHIKREITTTHFYFIFIQNTDTFWGENQKPKKEIGHISIIAKFHKKIITKNMLYMFNMF